ncbi:MAG: signal peptidase I [Actinomycetota bacterium]
MRRSSTILTALLFVAVCACGFALIWAWLAGWRLEVIATPSMEPTVPRQSIAVVVPIVARHVQEGDVISFRDPSDRRRGRLHRIVEVVDRRESQAAGIYFRTQGDANATADPLLVPDDDLRGRMRWHVPKLGAVAWVLRPPIGLLVLLGAPGVALVVGELRRRSPARVSSEEPHSMPTLSRSECELLACM